MDIMLQVIEIPASVALIVVVFVPRFRVRVGIRNMFTYKPLAQCIVLKHWVGESKCLMHSIRLPNELMLGVPISFVTECFRNTEIHTLALNWHQVTLVESVMEIQHPGEHSIQGGRGGFHNNIAFLCKS